MYVRVLELYCGIGGYHWALKKASGDDLQFQVVGAIDINTTVLDIYKYNFPDVNVMNRNIGSLTKDEINKMNIDMIVMSPPCQPFCRAGLQMDLEDNRTDSFKYILSLLPGIKFKYLVFENVKGFESSDARNELIKALDKCNFEYQEYLINPVDLGIPNSRLRYYLIGKFKNNGSSLSKSLGIESLSFHDVPSLASLENCENVLKSGPKFASMLKSEVECWRSRRLELVEVGLCNGITESSRPCIADVLESNVKKTAEVPTDLLDKYYQALDIVTPASKNSCCFTKSYGHYLKGTGSILAMDTVGATEHRIFTPREVLRLMCYPDLFKFPPGISKKQMYKSLGNSLNCYVVSILIAILVR